MVAVSLAIKLLLMNCIGILIQKVGIATKDFASRLTSLVLKCCIPCLIFNSTSSATEFSLILLKKCGIVILLSTGSVLLCFFIGQIFFCFYRRNGTGRIFRYGLTFCHFSFMGLPIIDALFGTMGTFYYTSFFLLPVRIAYYSFSETLMTPREIAWPKRGLRKTLKTIFVDPCLISLLLGLIFWIAGWHLPEAFNYCIKSMSSLSSPLALLLCGMILGEYKLKQFAHVKYLLLPLLRTLMMPAIFWIISRSLLMWGLDKLLCDMLVIYAALPIASLLPVYAIRYDPESKSHLSASAACTFSVLISAITIPIWYLLL